MNIILCYSQIYRHIFFNHDTIKKIKSYCFAFTAFFMMILYCHDNRERLLQLSQSTPGGTQQSITVDGSSSKRTLQILQKIDYPTAQRTILTFFIYVFTVIFATYIYKKV